MFEIAFSLHGRLKRLQYFLGALALGVAYVVGLGGLVVGGIVAAKTHNWGVVALLVLAVLPLAVAVLWCSLSLHVRRIRDMGWDPTIVIGSWLIFKVADKLILANVLPMLATRNHWLGTYVGLAVDITLSLVILFWPSHDQEDDGDRYLQPGPPRWAASGHLAPAPPPVPAARLARATGARREFGRRGL